MIYKNISFTLHLFSKISSQRSDSFQSTNIRLIVKELFISETGGSSWKNVGLEYRALSHHNSSILEAQHQRIAAEAWNFLLGMYHCTCSVLVFRKNGWMEERGSASHTQKSMWNVFMVVFLLLFTISNFKTLCLLLNAST